MFYCFRANRSTLDQIGHRLQKKAGFPCRPYDHVNFQGNLPLDRVVYVDLRFFIIMQKKKYLQLYKLVSKLNR
jgi:hypothetical protein